MFYYLRFYHQSILDDMGDLVGSMRQQEKAIRGAVDLAFKVSQRLPSHSAGASRNLPPAPVESLRDEEGHPQAMTRKRARVFRVQRNRGRRRSRADPLAAHRAMFFQSLRRGRRVR